MFTNEQQQERQKEVLRDCYEWFIQVWWSKDCETLFFYRKYSKQRQLYKELTNLDS